MKAVIYDGKGEQVKSFQIPENCKDCPFFVGYVSFPNCKLYKVDLKRLKDWTMVKCDSCKKASK